MNAILTPRAVDAAAAGRRPAASWQTFFGSTARRTGRRIV